jgi:hypothetical protein
MLHHPMTTPLLAVALSTTAAFGAPQWSADTSTNQVVSDATSDQSQPKVVPAKDGGYWVSWFDGIGTGWDVRLQRYGVQGDAIFPAGGLLVADRSFSSTQDYGLDVSQEGDALLAFRDDSSGLVEITAARYRPDGTAVYGASGLTLTSNDGFVASPRITEASGNVFVAWTQNSGVRVRVVDSGGTPTAVDENFAPSAGSYFLSDMHGGGGDAIFSVVHATGGFSSPRHLLIQRLQPGGGLPWGASPTPVFTAGSLQFGAFPQFATDAFGTSLLTWYSSTPTLQCFAQIVDSSGSIRWQPDGVPVAVTPGVRVNPALAQIGGTFLPVVAWREQNASQSQAGISAQRFDPVSGQRLWGDSGVSLSPVGSQLSSSPGLTLDVATESTTITWEESPSFGADRLFGAVIDGAGASLVPTFDVASAPSGKSRVTRAQGLAGGSLTAWSDSRSDGGDILVQQLGDGGAPGTVGIISSPSPTCIVFPNSLGFQSETFVIGSSMAAANENKLVTLSLPSNTFAFYITSQTAAFVPNPGGSVGNICVGGSVGRFVGLGQIQSTGTTGSIQLEIDLTQQPTPTGFVSVQSGETWYYQTWFRDFSFIGVGTNFSNASSVTYR